MSTIKSKLAKFKPPRLPLANSPKTDTKTAILALDIGTEYIKAVIAAPTKKHTLEIVGVGRAHQDANNMYAGAISDISGVVAVCEEALSIAENQAGLISKQTVVGIAGELIKGSTSTIRYHRSNGNKPITETEMLQIIKKIQERAGAIARKEVATETDNPAVEVRLINSAIVSLQIDGYKINNPIGFKGSELLIQFYTAFAPLVHISAIEKVCAELNLDLIAVAVEPFAVCRACLGDDLDSNFSAVVMDIGGGTTDLAIVDDGGVEGTKMFGIGGRSFTHQIAQRLGTDFAAAEKIKLAPDLSRLQPVVRSKVTQAISDNLEIWLSGVQLAIEDFSTLEVIPPRILLCGGGASLLELQEALATTDWYQDLAFPRRPVVHVVEPEDIPGIINTTDTALDQSYITAFGLLRVALDTLIGVPEGTGLKTRIAKILQN